MHESKCLACGFTAGPLHHSKFDIPNSPLPRDFFAAATAASTVMPNFSKQTLNGADAPNEDIPIKIPLSPMYLLQPNSTPASIPTLALTAGAMTESLYFWSCRSNSSQHGILTTCAFIPSLPSRSAAPRASETSEPLAQSSTSGLSAP